ncbi:hypothetical protein BD309DRAFT_1014886 [Dichomitus squalens]|nr:hypothetical protein BD309DRAFT_1014886 [Dichomitus squalens]
MRKGYLSLFSLSPSHVAPSRSPVPTSAHRHASPHYPPPDEHILSLVSFDGFQFFNTWLHGMAGVCRHIHGCLRQDSNELFSASKTTNLFGFLRTSKANFNVHSLPQLPDVPSGLLYRSPLQETVRYRRRYPLSPSSILFTSQPEDQPQAQAPHPQQSYAQSVAATAFQVSLCI